MVIINRNIVNVRSKQQSKGTSPADYFLKRFLLILSFMQLRRLHHQDVIRYSLPILLRLNAIYLE